VLPECWLASCSSLAGGKGEEGLRAVDKAGDKVGDKAVDKAVDKAAIYNVVGTAVDKAVVGREGGN
jgi:hypothetical protein